MANALTAIMIMSTFSGSMVRGEDALSSRNRRHSTQVALCHRISLSDERPLFDDRAEENETQVAARAG